MVNLTWRVTSSSVTSGIVYISRLSLHLEHFMNTLIECANLIKERVAIKKIIDCLMNDRIKKHPNSNRIAFYKLMHTNF